MSEIPRNPYATVLLVLTFALGIFLSTYKLTESPPPWRDEGIVLQVAKNFAERGEYAIQTAPNEMVSAGLVTNGYPLIYPVALSFKLFGSSMLSARSVMVLFILLLFVATYLLVKKESNATLAFYSLLVLVSFAPIYGQGRNVIGEVPGTALLFCFLLALYFISKQEQVTPKSVFCAGLLLGLVMATKPIFLMMLVPTAVITLIFFRPKNFSKKSYTLFALSTVLTVLLWFFTQFRGDTLTGILSIYSGNPEGIPLTSIVFKNIKDVLTHIETLYFVGLMGAWAVGIYIAKRSGHLLSLSEKFAFTFSLILSAAYFASVGYYRYFFPAEVLALCYLPLSLSRLIPLGEKWFKFSALVLRRTAYAALVCLFLFQMSQAGFHSFVSDYFGSTRTALLDGYLRPLSPETKMLVYNVPEAVIFLSSNNYYQYARFALTARGEEQLAELISKKIPDEIVIHSGDWEDRTEITASYEQKLNLGKYDILKRRAVVR